MPGLGSSYGRGGATTTQQDLQNSDVIMIMGSNFAECHPVGFRWVMKAKAKGAKLIHVDPRFTRTSAMADTYAPIRAGSDIIFLGGLINYLITTEKYFKEYVVAYTNAPTLVNEDFQDTEELDGVFSGYDPETRKYDATPGVIIGPARTSRISPMLGSMSPRHFPRASASWSARRQRKI